MGNELADELAKKGMINGQVAALAPSMTFIKRSLKTRMCTEWDRQCNNLTDCRHSKELIKFKPDADNRSFFIEIYKDKM